MPASRLILILRGRAPYPLASAYVRGRGAVSTMADRTSLRLAATLVLLGVLLSLVAGIFHPAREDPNDHQAVFAEYAESASWTAIHLGQFAGMAVLVAGLLVLLLALDEHAGPPSWAGRLG